MGIKLVTLKDFCHHTPNCDLADPLTFVVRDYATYAKAYRWLIENNKPAMVSGPYDHTRGYRRYTGRYIFKFYCHHEYTWFALKWA
jgi:hypothetical protein